MSTVKAVYLHDATSMMALGATPPSPHGYWENGAYVELLDDGVRVRLWDDLVFVDSKGRRHVAKTNFISDGSSHPKFSWSLFGGPLSGKYRRAAIIHDFLLSQVGADPNMTTEIAHEVFKDAMRADGLPEDEAELFFTAVVGASWWRSVSPTFNFVKSVIRWFKNRF